eukprot:CAMPEP_0185462802 /NCGR_PEP_ID=MMETSP1365-20130426/93389_1 /TAXON_ID=38817 /ORGANISM="Gephyrocapsa oceanica, Strain RCC1303" /LENGTH=71 /DNA_ID=CAMNT_0028069495 /DNA_START=132 /DNA_END=344 /DNA_ORIENTATION=+
MTRAVGGAVDECWSAGRDGVERPPSPLSIEWYARAAGALLRAADCSGAAASERAAFAACCCMSQRPWSVPY